ncbi:MAG: hypothetical protein ACE5F7_11570 [Nitrospiria bacterium]
MSLQRSMLTCAVFTALLVSIADVRPLQADEGHGHHEEKAGKMEKMDKMEHSGKKQEMHHHTPSKKNTGPDLPPGTKEVVIDLSGPFCSRHPEEITAGLMELNGVIHVEAFNRRDYILVHFNGDHVTPAQMEATVDSLKGSGWRCDGTVSTRKRTER